MHPGIGEGGFAEPRLEPTGLRLREIALDDDQTVNIAACRIEGLLGERAVEVDPGELGAEDLIERTGESSQGGGDGRGDAFHPDDGGVVLSKVRVIVEGSAWIRTSR